MIKKLWWPLNFTFTVLAAGLAIWSIADTHAMAYLYRFTSYYILLTLFLLWVWQWRELAIEKKFDGQLFLKQEWPGILFCIALSGIIFFSAKPYLRVLADETNLLAVSKSMTYLQTIDNGTMGSWHYGNYFPIAAEPPTRPILFPFLTHLIHLVTGYSANNPIIANFIFFSSLIFLVYFLFSREQGKIWGVTAVFAVCAQPLVTQTATSGGFDLLNLLFIFICFFLAKLYLTQPSPATFAFLWTSGLMFSHVRYESMPFFILILIMLAGLKKIRWRDFKSSLIYGLTPLLSLPLLWGRRIHLALKDPFQSGSIEEGFGVSAFQTNAQAFLDGFFKFNDLMPYSAALNWLGVIALIYFIYHSFQKNSWGGKQENKILWWGSVLFTGLYLCLMLYWFAGWPKHATNARYFTFYAFVFSILAVMLLKRIRFFQARPFIAALIMLGVLITYHGRTVENRFSNTQTLPRQYYRVLEFIEKLHTRHFLLVTDRPGMYTAHNYGAVDFKQANAKSKKYLASLGRSLYENIFIIQEIEYATGQPLPNMVLNPEYSLETVYEFQNTLEKYVRISKVKRQ